MRRGFKLELVPGTSRLFLGRRQLLKLCTVFFAPGILVMALSFSVVGPVLGEDGAAEASKMDDETSRYLSRPWVGPDGEPLPFSSNREVEEFLLTAQVVSMKKIPNGITKPRKVLLEKGGVRCHAVFRQVDVYKPRWVYPGRGPRLNFLDCHIYECAAYRLSSLLGLNRVPPAVLREIKGREGSLQIWVENCMMETDRRTFKIKPPDPWNWEVQKSSMRIFDELVFNDDRNQGNMLIDPNWRLWLIDHTRAFRTFPQLANPQIITSCERRLWERLKAVKPSVVEAELRGLLSPREIGTLLKRLDRLVERLNHLIEVNGEAGVLRDLKSRRVVLKASTSDESG